ncbi:MAG: HAMP domain-containing protein [Magnetococcales bacterium]|nr:HAMP domain-containing protein [Magnetococcales bacterium]
MLILFLCAFLIGLVGAKNLWLFHLDDDEMGSVLVEGQFTDLFAHLSDLLDQQVSILEQGMDALNDQEAEPLVAIIEQFQTVGREFRRTFPDQAALSSMIPAHLLAQTPDSALRSSLFPKWDLTEAVERVFKGHAPSLMALENELKGLHRVFENHALSILNGASEVNGREGRKTLQAMRENARAMDRSVKALGQKVRQVSHEILEALHDREVDTLYWTGLFLMSGFALAGLGAVLLGLDVRSFLRQSRGMVQRIAAGDLEVTVPAPRRDELGQLLHAIQEMAAALKHSRRLEEEKTLELKRSNAELLQFAQVISHDLQAPLRTIASFAQLLAERYQHSLERDAHEFIGLMVASASRMQQMIHDLLVYSRVNTHSNPLTLVATQSLVLQVLDQLHATVQESAATIVVGELPMVRADSTQLAQLFQNLLVNALKFRGQERPRVEIVARPLPQDAPLSRGWLFQVKDNGIGIDPQHGERIFEIFQRLHTSEEYPGTGIGLAICQRIVERHGGRIWVESVPGAGAVFSFTWPGADEVHHDNIPC